MLTKYAGDVTVVDNTLIEVRNTDATGEQFLYKIHTGKSSFALALLARTTTKKRLSAVRKTATKARTSTAPTTRRRTTTKSKTAANHKKPKSTRKPVVLKF